MDEQSTERLLQNAHLPEQIWEMLWEGAEVPEFEVED